VPAALFGTADGWSSDGNVLRMDMAPAGDGVFGYNGALSSTTGYTVEVRFRVETPPTAGHSAALQLVAADNQWFVLDIFPNKILNEADGSLLANVDLTGSFHTLRVAVQEGGGAALVFLDGLEITSALAPGSWGSGYNRAWFGDESNAIVDGVVLVDYFRVDPTGLFAPLPLAIAGDFDSDGDVDGADFVVWQTNFPTASGAILSDGDADGDGDVDGADFVVWQTNFPKTSDSTLAVPEPQEFFVLSAGSLLFVAFSAHRRTPSANPRS
jgi:hypothetical protein